MIDNTFIKQKAGTKVKYKSSHFHNGNISLVEGAEAEYIQCTFEKCSIFLDNSIVFIECNFRNSTILENSLNYILKDCLYENTKIQKIN